MEQGSEEWLLARLGCITMSNADKLLTEGKGVTRNTYIIGVASELITGVPSDRINVWDMERGSLLEPFARQAYEAYKNCQVQQVGLVYLNEKKRISASPDGFIVNQNHGLEIKCQAPKNHMKTIIEAKNPKKFMPQIQGSMWVTGYDKWDYCSFCPEFKAQPLFVMTVERDDKMIAAIEKSALKAVTEVDEYVKQAQGSTSPELFTICQQAIELTDIMQNKEPEIF